MPLLSLCLSEFYPPFASPSPVVEAPASAIEWLQSPSTADPLCSAGAHSPVSPLRSVRHDEGAPTNKPHSEGEEVHDVRERVAMGGRAQWQRRSQTIGLSAAVSAVSSPLERTARLHSHTAASVRPVW